MFERKFIAGGAEMDFNAHMRNTAFLDMCTDIRFLYFAANDFPADEFTRRSIGPAVMHDDVRYHAEIMLLEEVTVSLALAGLADDGSRFRFRSEIHKADGKLAARVTSTGGWLDLDKRKLVAPPGELLSIVKALDCTDDFEVLPSSLNRATSA